MLFSDNLRHFIVVSLFVTVSYPQTPEIADHVHDLILGDTQILAKTIAETQKISKECVITHENLGN